MSTQQPELFNIETRTHGVSIEPPTDAQREAQRAAEENRRPNSVREDTQTGMILRHLADYGSITPMDALDQYGCMRLAARICDLRKIGYEIEGEMEIKTNAYGQQVTYKRYSMKGAE